uniref:LysR family transcriptional regulator n=1 Tax=Thermosporothrix sp. COM3 TaxID=2490863 RepID=A0A455SKH2_9CHLR|nr:LysR family transcriptional regulator [Thermosporothrix sp. COM3]
MELRQLETFLTIVKEGSFAKAAEKLEYAQSTITVHVQQLEAELGVKLFARQGKQMQLTEAGKVLWEQAAVLRQRAVALQQTMREIITGEAGQIRLGAIEPTASLRLAPLLITFSRTFPKLRLALEVGNAALVNPRVQAGELDFAISSPPEAQTGLTFEPLFFEDLRVLLPAHHSLVNKEPLEATDLKGQRILLTDRGCGYRAVIEKALLSLGINPFSGIEMGSIEILKHAVQGELGIALLPDIAVTPPPSQTVVRKLQGVDLRVPVGLVSPPEECHLGRPQQELLAFLRTHLQK